MYNAIKKQFKLDEGSVNRYKDILNLSNEDNKELPETLNLIKSFVKTETRDLTANQLRNIWDEIKSVREPGKLQLVRPKLAYIAGRNNRIRNLVEFFDSLASDVTTKKQVESYKTFMEAIVSYHKFYHD